MSKKHKKPEKQNNPKSGPILTMCQERALLSVAREKGSFAPSSWPPVFVGRYAALLTWYTEAKSFGGCIKTPYYKIPEIPIKLHKIYGVLDTLGDKPKKGIFGALVLRGEKKNPFINRENNRDDIKLISWRELKHHKIAPLEVIKAYLSTKEGATKFFRSFRRGFADGLCERIMQAAEEEAEEELD